MSALHAAIYAICFTTGLFMGVVYPLPSIWYGAFGAVLGWKIMAYHRKKESIRIEKLLHEHNDHVQAMFEARRNAS